MFPVGCTLIWLGELTTEPESDRVCPGLGTRFGELETEPESSPEWVLLPDSDLLGEGLGPLSPERDPDELELLLLVVVSPPWAGRPGCRVSNGETGDPGSSCLESGLFLLLLSKISESRNRLESLSDLVSEMGLSESDIVEHE